MTSPAASPAPQPASTAQYKAALRAAKRKAEGEAEIDFLNITAMLDMMTIILVFLLKTMASSSTSLPQSTDLTLPTSVLYSEPHQDGVAVVVTKSQILVGDKPAIEQLPSRESLAQSGLDAIYKRNGINDLQIVPLAEMLVSAREADRQIRAARGLDPSTSEAIVIVDETTPYRVLVEVLYTLGQSGFGKYHLMVLSGKRQG